MGREELSRDDQEQLDYVNAWWETKRQREKEKKQRKAARKMCLSGARYHIHRALIEMQQYFTLLWRRK
ncbi:MAG: hypothetical protein J6I97_05890 [Agathobacter sp.]|nr:hypothetical protein [Agathobacter sp.]